MRLIPHENLRAVTRALVAAGGSLGEEPRLVADNLVDANLLGHDSHGVGMLPAYLASIKTGELKVNRHAKVVSDQGAILVIDGEAGYGQVIGTEAMALGIARARAQGACVLAIRRSYHLCRIGAWGELCAEAGLVSLHHVNSVGHAGLVAPFRGTDARFSTNPYCCTLPATENTPAIVADFATSVIAMGKVRVAKNRGERVSDGVLIDAAGQPTNDPAVMFESPGGALRPLGGHKGYCLALVNELLAGAVTGGGTCRPATDHANPTILNNMLSILIDPGRLGGRAAFATELDACVAHVTASPPMRPDEPVLIPGDPERLSAAARRADGIAIDDESWRELLAAGASLGVGADRIEGLASGA